MTYNISTTEFSIVYRQFGFVKGVEVRVEQGHPGGDALVGVKSHHALEKVQAYFFKSARVLAERNSLPFGECWLKVRQFDCGRPVVVVGGAEDLEDFEYLVYFGVADEEGFFLNHFCENAAGGPDVDAKCVLLLAEEDFGAAVPESDHFVRVSLDWEAERPCQAKISELHQGTC